jgi:hypothetical protein
MDWAPALYVIRVDGHLGAMTLSAFPGMTPQHRSTHTVFTGWLDQSALYGVLAQMEALGLVLVEVRPDEAAWKITGTQGYPLTLMTDRDIAPRHCAGRRSCPHRYLIRDPHSRHRPTLQTRARLGGHGLRHVAWA